MIKRKKGSNDECMYFETNQAITKLDKHAPKSQQPAGY